MRFSLRLQRRRRVHLSWAVPALLALVVCLTGISRPVLWQDELATLSAADRSLPALLKLMRHQDGGLIEYYSLMHVWTSLVGTSPTALRLPSAAAMAAAAALTSAIGSRLGGLRSGLFAGALLALLPVVSAYGQEARSYALCLMLSALSTLLLLRMLDLPSWPRALAYGASVVVLGGMQLTAVLIVGAHAVAVAACWRDRRGRLAVRWLTAVGLAALLLAPVAYVGHRQRGQVDWIQATTVRSLAALPGQLIGSPELAGLVGGLALLGIGRYGRRSWLALAVAVVPVAELLTVSVAIPLFIPRYLVPTIMGWTLLAGGALARAKSTQVVAVLVAVIAFGLPAQVAVRGDTKHGQPDYRAIAAVMATQTRPGDAVVVPSGRGGDGDPDPPRGRRRRTQRPRRPFSGGDPCLPADG